MRRFLYDPDNHAIDAAIQNLIDKCTCICSNWPGGSAVYIANPNCPTHGDTARDGDKEAAR